MWILQTHTHISAIFFSTRILHTHIMTKNPLDHFLSQVVEKPQVFFSSNQKIVDSALEMAKHFYDDGKKKKRRSRIVKKYEF